MGEESARSMVARDQQAAQGPAQARVEGRGEGGDRPHTGSGPGKSVLGASPQPWTSLASLWSLGTHEVGGWLDLSGAEGGELGRSQGPHVLRSLCLDAGFPHSQKDEFNPAHASWGLHGAACWVGRWGAERKHHSCRQDEPVAPALQGEPPGGCQGRPQAAVDSGGLA